MLSTKFTTDNSIAFASIARLRDGLALLTGHLYGIRDRRLPRSGRYEQCVSPAQLRTDFPSPQRHPRQPKPPDQNLKRREILQQCPCIGKRHSPNEDHKSGNKTSTAQRIFYAGWRG